MIKKNILSIIAALGILYLSISGADTYDKISIFSFPGADYLAHFIMYFVFMGVIVFEHRNSIYKIRTLFIISLIPLFYGALMELLQLGLTVSRTGSWTDLLFNLAGIMFLIIICLIIKPIRKKLIK